MNLPNIAITPMGAVLAIGALVIVISFWRAHKAQNVEFNAFDLVMENGRVSKSAFLFMLAGAVSNWVIVDLQINSKLTEGMFGLWLTAWVAPLIAKVVFQKTEMPGTTTTTSMTETTTVKEPAP